MYITEKNIDSQMRLNIPRKYLKDIGLNKYSTAEIRCVTNKKCKYIKISNKSSG